MKSEGGEIVASGWWLARQIAVRSNRRMGQIGAGYEIITAKLPSGVEWSSLRKQFEQEHAEVTEEREKRSLKSEL